MDRSTRFVFTLAWFRLICSNGLVIGTKLTEVGDLHTKRLDTAQLSEIVQASLQAAAEDRSQLGRWNNTRVTNDQLCGWVDGPVQSAWGASAAARAYLIASTGEDGVLVGPANGHPPSRREMRATASVPGAIVPAEHAFAAIQVLSWIATHQRDRVKRVVRMRAIQGLMRKLLN